MLPQPCYIGTSPTNGERYTIKPYGRIWRRPVDHRLLLKPATDPFFADRGCNVARRRLLKFNSGTSNSNAGRRAAGLLLYHPGHRYGSAGMVDFRHLRLCFISAALVLGAFSAAPRHAQAQNLVQNPNFFDGLTDYTTTADSDENVFASSFSGGPTNPAEGGTNAAEGDVSGAPAVISQSLTTTTNTLYLVTFAYAVDPETADSFTVTFGNQTRTYTTSVSDGSSPFDVVSFTAKSSSPASVLTFTGTEGAFAVSELDVEAGPAPVAGGGTLSFGLIAAGFAGRHFRRRRSTTSPISRSQPQRVSERPRRPANGLGAGQTDHHPTEGHPPHWRALGTA
jgi:hypothetical protein